MTESILRRRAYDVLKRILDFAGAVVLLVLLSPVLLGTAFLVRARLGSPVLFSQARPGRDAKIFKLYKFRSMMDIDPSRGLVTDEQRLTPFGKKLRSASLDELPSLWNVIRGDMSFVGPRPLLVEYLEHYTSVQARRHEVRPGITGLAQASGRNGLSWEEKFRLDVEYVERRGLVLDVRVLIATVRAVVVRDGISAEGHATTPRFGES